MSADRRALLAGARKALSPSDEERHRTKAALAAKLAGAGVAATLTLATTKTATTVVSGGAKIAASWKVAAALAFVGVGAAATGVAVSSRSAELPIAPTATAAAAAPTARAGHAAAGGAGAPLPTAIAPTAEDARETNVSTTVPTSSPRPTVRAAHRSPSPGSPGEVRGAPEPSSSIGRAPSETMEAQTGGPASAAVIPHTPPTAPREAGPLGASEPGGTPETNSGGRPALQARGSEGHGGAIPEASLEVDLVRQMHAALARGDHARCIALATEHGKRFPAGLLGEEVGGLRMAAECTRGGEEARGRGRSFVASHPRSPIVDRVRKACGGQGS